MSESQTEISTRLRKQLAEEEKFRFKSLYYRLMCIPRFSPDAINAAVDDLSKEDAMKVIDWLDWAPGDNQPLREAIGKKFPRVKIFPKEKDPTCVLCEFGEEHEH